MKKFFISGLLVIAIVFGGIYFKAKKPVSHETLVSPLSLLKPYEKSSLAKTQPKLVTLEKKEKLDLRQSSEPAALPKKRNPPIIRKSGVTSKPLKVIKTPHSPTKILTIPEAPRMASSEASIQNIQRELKSVMDLNKKINAVQSNKSSQLLRIQEQVMIQQRILNDIQKTSTSSSKVKTPTKEALLAQEKLRIIQEENLKNKETLEKQLNSKSPS